MENYPTKLRLREPNDYFLFSSPSPPLSSPATTKYNPTANAAKTIPAIKMRFCYLLFLGGVLFIRKGGLSPDQTKEDTGCQICSAASRLRDSSKG